MHFILSDIVSNNQPRKIGSIADMDPLNGVYGSIDYTNSYAQQHQSRYTPQQQQQQQQLQPIQQPIQQNQQSAIQLKPKSISSQVVSVFWIFSDLFINCSYWMVSLLIFNLECILNNNIYYSDWIIKYSVYSVPSMIMKLKIRMKSVLRRVI